MQNVTKLGQVFTPDRVVEQMLHLRHNFGSILEPSAGTGAFLSRLEAGAVGIEIDATLNQDTRVIPGDFFAYSLRHRFDTIMGNPPYVRFQDIGAKTRAKLPLERFEARSNLYLFFIDKCIDHLKPEGELIFITPRDFLKAASARHVNQRLFAEGSMTHYYELGDQVVFSGFFPNCAIWRWVKGRQSRQMVTGGQFLCQDGYISFSEPAPTRLGDCFEVRVGAVSGADAIFADSRRGCTDFVCSTTARDGKYRRMIYNRMDQSLWPHKAALLRRKVRQFDESNWWEWGRKFCRRPGPRIYVNSRTRNRRPFYVSEAEAYDGSMLALFPKTGIDVEEAVVKLNAVNWEQLGFVCGGRLLFSKRSLENAPVDWD